MLSMPKYARKLLEGSSLNRGGPRLQLDAMRPHPPTGSKILSASCGPEVEPAALSDAVWSTIKAYTDNVSWRPFKPNR